MPSESAVPSLNEDIRERRRTTSHRSYQAQEYISGAPSPYIKLGHSRAVRPTARGDPDSELEGAKFTRRYYDLLEPTLLRKIEQHQSHQKQQFCEVRTVRYLFHPCADLCAARAYFPPRRWRRAPPARTYGQQFGALTGSARASAGSAKCCPASLRRLYYLPTLYELQIVSVGAVPSARQCILFLPVERAVPRERVDSRNIGLPVALEREESIVGIYTSLVVKLMGILGRVQDVINLFQQTEGTGLSGRCGRPGSSFAINQWADSIPNEDQFPFRLIDAWNVKNALHALVMCIRMPDSRESWVRLPGREHTRAMDKALPLALRRLQLAAQAGGRIKTCTRHLGV
ncbi:hypothetical protein GGX14DRAFT_635506 [Mycena pura]|uniref:Uncharacterized protein n=1 Tax=Mycena pura TaxID=153505 RepID=A0AAD6YBL2_9AGAR|nr:hypothetical protein GGX14DRAFT_635506 [Mycena pura]